MLSLNINYDSCNSTYSIEKNAEQLDKTMKHGTYVYTKSIHYFQSVE
jgi:hypothetical protein